MTTVAPYSTCTLACPRALMTSSPPRAATRVADGIWAWTTDAATTVNDATLHRSLIASPCRLTAAQKQAHLALPLLRTSCETATGPVLGGGVYHGHQRHLVTASRYTPPL